MARKKRTDNKGRVLRNGEQQRSDGMYRYRFTDASGQQKTIYSTSLVELREKEEEVKRLKMEGVNYSNITLNKWFKDYMENCKKGKLKEQTYTRYNQYWDWYVKDRIGKMKIKDIKRMNIIKMYTDYLNGKDNVTLSIGTLKYINNLLNSAFNYAVVNDVILKNPCINIMKEFCKEQQKQKIALTQREQQLFINYVGNATDTRIKIYEPLFVVAFGTGLRIGELLALTWDDIDLKNNVINVSKTIYYQPQPDKKRVQKISTPKTKNSIRTVPLLPEVRKALNEQKVQQFKLGIPRGVEVDGYNNFIFTTMNGTPYISDAINSVIKRIVKRINEREIEVAVAERREPELLPEFSAHIMRHTFCTRLCENDLNVKTIQMIMGHGDISTTMNIYTHVTEEKKQIEMQKLYNIKIS
ncbi:MAG: site-specific integrase [Eubacterium sp.]|nr:site-specific integrase [Eubacterium sp.]